MNTLDPPWEEFGRILCDRYGEPLALEVTDFSALKVAEVETILDFKQVDLPLPDTIATPRSGDGGAVSYVVSRSGTALSTSVAANSIAGIQSKRYLNYQPGKRLICDLTWSCQSVAAGTAIENGYFTDTNGIFFRQTSTDAYVVKRSDVSGSAVDTAVARENWDDPLDGTGPSGETLDLSTSAIFFIAFAWFGVGDVVCGFIINRKPCPVYRFRHNNALIAPYMRTPNLPVRWQVSNGAGGASGATTLYATCATVGLEGGQQPQVIPGTLEAPGTGATAIACGAGVRTELLSIRLRDSVNLTVYPTGISGSATSNDTGFFELLYNATPTGAATWVDPPEGSNSPIQVSYTNRAITSPGKILAAAEFTSQSRAGSEALSRLIALGRSYAGVSDVVTLACRSFGAQNVIGTLKYQEVR